MRPQSLSTAMIYLIEAKLFPSVRLHDLSSLVPPPRWFLMKIILLPQSEPPASWRKDPLSYALSLYSSPASSGAQDPQGSQTNDRPPLTSRIALHLIESLLVFIPHPFPFSLLVLISCFSIFIGSSLRLLARAGMLALGLLLLSPSLRDSTPPEFPSSQQTHP